MKKRYLSLLALLLTVTVGVYAQTGLVRFEDPLIEKSGDRIHLQATMNLSGLELHKQSMLTVTPILRSLDGREQVAFDPVVILGKTRHKAIIRAEKLDKFRFDPTPSDLVDLHKDYRETVPFNLETAYEPWMRNAELVFDERVTGCLNAELDRDQPWSISPVLPPVFVPTYHLTYVEPPTEAVKQRSESYAARINFLVARYEIRRDYMNNAAVLDEVDKVIAEVRNDSNLTITEFKVTGYASPEGAAASNLRLSENRAKAFVDYVGARHGIPASTMQVDWKGDDWDGLKKLMEESAFSEKGRVLDILNRSLDPQQRKNQLKNMGSAYRTLLSDYYPYLRRNEYTISYIARPFSVEEAKVLIKTKPQHLSLNEMFLVANTYPKNSPEFKEVFDIAVRLYPNDPYANLNGAALDIENGAYDVALQRSLKVEMPEAWNNIGYIYIQKKAYDLAQQYFKKAADAGLPVAIENLQQLNKWMEDPE